MDVNAFVALRPVRNFGITGRAYREGTAVEVSYLTLVFADCLMRCWLGFVSKQGLDKSLAHHNVTDAKRVSPSQLAERNSTPQFN